MSNEELPPLDRDVLEAMSVAPEEIVALVASRSRLLAALEKIANGQITAPGSPHREGWWLAVAAEIEVFAREVLDDEREVCG